jgi:hypothetical protein
MVNQSVLIATEIGTVRENRVLPILYEDSPPVILSVARKPPFPLFIEH